MKNSIEKLILEYSTLAAEELGKGNLEKSLLLLEKSEKLMKTTEDLTQRQNCFRSLSQVYGKYYLATQDYQKAGSYFEDLIKFSYSSLQKTEACETLQNLCNIYTHTKNYQKLLERARQGLFVVTEITDSSSGALFHYYAAVAHQNMQNFGEAEKAYKESLSIANTCLGYSHPTTGLVMQKYLKFLKVSQTPKALARVRAGSRNNDRQSTGKSYDSRSKIISSKKSSKKHFLPKIRNSYKGDQGLLPIIPACKTSIKTPRAITNAGEFSEDIPSPVKHLPQTSCRIRARRLSADSSISRMTEKNPLNPNQLLENNGKNDHFDGGSSKNEKNDGSFESKLQKSKDFTERIVKSDEKVRKNHENLMKSDEKIKKVEKNYCTSQVIRIQKYIRGHLARKILRSLKRESLKTRAVQAVSDLNDLKAQILILKTVEHKSKEWYKAEYTKKDVIDRVSKSIILIQRYFRKYRQRFVFLKTRSSLIKIQSLVKMYLVKVLFQKILLAIRFIQSSWRQYKKKCN
jgi:tetratricopeptide (TPR) repeat protein